MIIVYYRHNLGKSVDEKRSPKSQFNELKCQFEVRKTLESLTHIVLPAPPGIIWKHRAGSSLLKIISYVSPPKFQKYLDKNLLHNIWR